MIAIISPSITVTVMSTTGGFWRALSGLRLVAPSDLRGYNEVMKLLFEFVVALIFHPIAFILALINIAGRTDLTPAQKIIWGVVSVVWGIGPILYVLVGGGQLW
jgi:hypothetical protein